VAGLRLPRVVTRPADWGFVAGSRDEDGFTAS